MIPLRSQDAMETFALRVKNLDDATRPDDTGKSLLWRATYFNDTHAVAVLLKYGGVAVRSQINEADREYGLTPLDLALKQRDPAIFNEMKTQDIHMNANPFYRSSIHS